LARNFFSLLPLPRSLESPPLWAKMSKDKAVVVDVEQKGDGNQVSAEEFDPPPSVLKNDDALMSYLAYYNGQIGDDVQVSMAPKGVEYQKAPDEAGGVYFAAQVLALGAHLPLPDFVRKVLVYYRLAPTQISPGSWRVLLGFDALGRSQRATLGVEEFRAVYLLKSLGDNCYCFSPRHGWSKMVLEVPTSDRGWKGAIVRVTGNWESSVPAERGLIPRAWGEPDAHDDSPASPAAEDMVRNFYGIPKGDRHWGVLLNPWRPGGSAAPRVRGPPPATKKRPPRPKKVAADVVVTAVGATEDEVEEDDSSTLKTRRGRSRGGAAPVSEEELGVPPSDAAVPSGARASAGGSSMPQRGPRKKVVAVSNPFYLRRVVRLSMLFSDAVLVVYLFCRRGRGVTESVREMITTLSRSCCARRMLATSGMWPKARAWMILRRKS
jgi:hypothetical protein